MKDFASTVEAAMVDWWTANGERTDLQFRFGLVIEQRIFDARPNPYPVPKHAPRMVKFLGMPVAIDDCVPKGEIHIVDSNRVIVGKLVGFDSV